MCHEYLTWGCFLCVCSCIPFVLQFTKAVESKQVAEQDAERAKFVVMLAEQVRGKGIETVVMGGGLATHETRPHGQKESY